MLLSEEPDAMNVLPSIQYILWVHVQGLASLGHNQYIGVLSIQAHKAPISCGTRFDENCKTTNSCSSWCLLLHEEQHAMDMLPPILL